MRARPGYLLGAASLSSCQFSMGHGPAWTPSPRKHPRTPYPDPGENFRQTLTKSMWMNKRATGPVVGLPGWHQWYRNHLLMQET